MLEILKDDKEILEVSNGIISLKFYKIGENQGKYEIKFRNNSDVECGLKECYSSINVYTSNSKNLAECPSYKYTFESKVIEIKDSLGTGLQVIFNTLAIPKPDFTFKIKFKMYDELDCILIKMIDIADISKDPSSIHSISPLTIINSNLWLSGSSSPTDLNNISWFKNGWQSWSPCKVYFGKEKQKIGLPLKIARRVLDNQDYQIKGRFYSEYCTVLTDLDSTNSIILGFVTLKDQFSRIIFDYEDIGLFKKLTAFGCMDGIKLSESSINNSEELYITFKPDNQGYYGLIDYAKVVKAYMEESRIENVPIGWCSWYIYFTKVTQEDVIKNLDFFKKNKKNLPIDFIQLDDGYFTKIGDYNIVNEKFSGGLEWLFTQIKNAGFKSGIWTAPFFAIKNSKIIEKHPNWFIKKNGSKKLLKTHFNPAWGFSFLYALDLTKKEVLNYLKDLFNGLVSAFRDSQVKSESPLIDFFKIDFLHASVPFDGNYQDKTLTRAQSYYNGVKAIREGITDESFLLGCGAPLGPCVGLVDAMRIGTDTAPYWKLLDGLGESLGFAAPSLKRGLLPVLYRSFMHKYFWINDPDCLMIRRTDTKLKLDEIKLQLTVFGLSGGQVLISDDMSELSEDEINDAKLLIPPYNPEDSDPIPTDILYSKYPSIYMLETDEDIRKRYLTAIINWGDKPLTKRLKISEIVPILPIEEERFYIYDYWNQSFRGEYDKDDILELNQIKPHSCRYLSIIPIDDYFINEPLLLSSNLHITQGCCEITEFNYDDEKNTLSIIIDLIGKREGNLYIKLPENKSISSYTFDFSKIDAAQNIWRLSVEFTDSISLEIELS